MDKQFKVAGVNLRETGYSTVMLQEKTDDKKIAMQVVVNFTDPKEAATFVPGETVTISISKQ